MADIVALAMHHDGQVVLCVVALALEAGVLTKTPFCKSLAPRPQR